MQNCGREVTVEEQPEAVVAMDGAAETVFALGQGGAVKGYFGATADSLPEALAGEASKTEHLGGTFPAPSLEAIIAEAPDLVLLYGYYEEAGVTAERLDELNIPHFVLNEACVEGDTSMDGYLDDVVTIATVLGVPDKGKQLVEEWTNRIDEAAADEPTGHTVFIQGSPDPASVFASGGTSFANSQIELAGGTNIYADSDEGYLTPSWEDVAAKNPSVIVNGVADGPGAMESLKGYINDNPALAAIDAAKEDRYFGMKYAENVPGPQAVEGTIALAEFLAAN
ncbi:ABC transporter substrate-binding protein [Arthrobacter tecti]